MECHKGVSSAPPKQGGSPGLKVKDRQSCRGADRLQKSDASRNADDPVLRAEQQPVLWVFQFEVRGTLAYAKVFIQDDARDVLESVTFDFGRAAPDARAVDDLAGPRIENGGVDLGEQQEQAAANQEHSAEKNEPDPRDCMRIGGDDHQAKPRARKQRPEPSGDAVFRANGQRISVSFDP